MAGHLQVVALADTCCAMLGVVMTSLEQWLDQLQGFKIAAAVQGLSVDASGARAAAPPTTESGGASPVLRAKLREGSEEADAVDFERRRKDTEL